MCIMQEFDDENRLLETSCQYVCTSSTRELDQIAVVLREKSHILLGFCQFIYYNIVEHVMIMNVFGMASNG